MTRRLLALRFGLATVAAVVTAYLLHPLLFDPINFDEMGLGRRLAFGLHYGSIYGVLLGVAQGLVLRAYVRGIVERPGATVPAEAARRELRGVLWWPVATVAGAVGGSLLGVSSWWLASDGDTYWAGSSMTYFVLLETLISGVAGAALGLGQWQALRRRAPRSGSWIAGTAMGDAAGSLVINLLFWTVLAGAGDVWWARALAAVISGGALGAAQGWRLLRVSAAWPADIAAGLGEQAERGVEEPSRRHDRRIWFGALGLCALNGVVMALAAAGAVRFWDLVPLIPLAEALAVPGVFVAKLALSRDRLSWGTTLGVAALMACAAGLNVWLFALAMASV